MRIIRLRLGLTVAILILSLSGCFKDASDDNAAPTKLQEVNLSDIQRAQPTATVALPSPTPTARRAFPTFTPRSPTDTPEQIVGGPPSSRDADTPTSTRRPRPTATDVPPDEATVAPPNQSGATDEPSETPTPRDDDEPVLPTPTEIPDANDCIYLVEGGDTLFSIALQFDLFPEDFYPINPELRANPDNLYIGQEIRIPDCIPEGATIEPTTEDTMEDDATPSTDVPEGTQTYVVQEGDNLFRIALNFGISLDALVAANPNIPNENTIIYPGDTLIIPTE